MSAEIIVCGKRYDIGWPVVSFEDSAGFSAYVPHRTDNVAEIFASHPAPGLAQRATRYRARRLMGGSNSLDQLRQVVRQVTIHLDGCRDAATCYNVLHNERGLSVHFMVDNDGTIYQTLDVLHCAFHAAGVNEVAVGIELQNLGDAARHPHAYAAERPAVTCTVHGVQFLCYDFTERQYQAMVHLCRALTRIFDIPLTSPQVGGAPLWTRLDDPREFRGMLGHYHVSLNKWDPGPWDFSRLLRMVGSSTLTFPLTKSRPEAAGAGTLRDDLARRYYDDSEQDVVAHFPVGPLGESALWHGGVHLAAAEGRRIFAIARGRVVAARMGPSCPLGSCNFVLLRHDFNLRGQATTFFSLYYHVAAQGWDNGGVGELPWMVSKAGLRARERLERGDVALLDIDVDGGQVIGTVTEAGPPGYREPQLHFAVFSADDLGAKLDPGHWDVIESDGRSRFCHDPRLLRMIDRSVGGRRPDGKLSRRELRNFFQLNPQREQLRRVAIHYRAEWTPGEWAEQLEGAPDFALLSPSRRRALIDQQIAPTLWWTPNVAEHAGLPTDGFIYAYHPLGFIVWLQQLIARDAVSRASGIGGADQWRGQLAPSNLTVDSEAADAMTDHEDYYSGELGKQLDLEDLVRGYPE